MPKQNDQGFYYEGLGGRLLGNTAREELVLQELKKLDSKDMFLEVGCAQGYFEKKALEFTENAFGGDNSPESTRAAKANCPKGEFARINAEELPFKSKVFDLVLCTEVLEHVPNWTLALKELQRVSRKKVLVTVPLEKGFFWRAFSKVKGMNTRGHLHKLGSREVKMFLEKGWNVSKQEIVATPSRRLNRKIKNKLGEKLGIFVMLLLEKEK